jgi:hypothetical protein
MGEKIFEWSMMKFVRAEKTNNLINIFVYVLMVIGVGGAYLAIRWYGEGLSSVSAVQTMKSAGGSASSSADMMLHVLLALVVVNRDGADARSALSQDSSTAGDRRDHRRNRAWPFGPGANSAGGRRICAAPIGRALSQYNRSNRRDSLYVPGRARARPKAAAQSRPRYCSDIPRQHPRAISNGCGLGADPVSDAVTG